MNNYFIADMHFGHNGRNGIETYVKQLKTLWRAGEYE